MKRKTKNQRGVTLIALVVTIVVLLILAGITIASVTKDNGIIKEANSAKDSVEMQALEAQIEMAIIKVEQKYRNPTLDQVIKEIEKIEHVTEVDRQTGAIKNDLGEDITGKLDDYINKGSIEEEKLIITSHPSDIKTISKIKDIQFSVEVEGGGTKTYQWYQNSTNSNSGGTEISGATNNTYTIAAANVTSALSGNYYYCIVSQKHGGSTETQISNPAQLIVISQVAITKQPTGVTVKITTGASFSIEANGGNGELSYQWYYNTSSNTTGGTVIPGATSSSYTMPAGTITTNMSGRYYYCIVTQKYGDATARVTSNVALLTVKPSYGASEIAKSPTTYYGAQVTGYGCISSPGVQKWRIFYSDSQNIYLIADDYISYIYAPNGKGGSEIYRNTTNEKLSFDEVAGDYSGSSWIEGNSLAKKWLNRYLAKNSVNSYTNICAVAYMMDTNIWKRFAGGDAEYAMAGPTIELFCASYKDTHASKYIECEAETSKNGYNIKWNTDSTYNTYISGVAKDFNEIYMKSETSKANAMWIASPSAKDAGSLLNIKSTGSLNFDAYDSGSSGFRPVVCLKSTVRLNKTSDGVYAIE